MMNAANDSLRESAPAVKKTGEAAGQPVFRGHLPALDGVRGIAIIMVLLLHFVGNMVPTTGLERAIVLVTNYGAYGVDLFFVLSGFLITGILYESRNKEHYFRNFYMRRVLRIFPLYYAVLVAIVFVAPLIPVLKSSGFEVLREHQAYLWLYSVNIYDGIQGVYSLPYLDHFWSLSVEEHFYFVWPMVVWLLAKTPRNLMRVSLGIAMAALVGRMVATAAGVSPISLFVLTPYRLDALCLGAFLAVYVRQPGGAANIVSRIAPTAAIAGAIVIASFAWNLFSNAGVEILRPLRSSLFLVLMAMMMLHTLAARPGSLAFRFFRDPTMIFFGKYSYGLYVFHHFFSYYMMTHRTEFLLAERLGSHGAAIAVQAVVGIAASVAVAYLSYELFEKHFLSLKGIFSSEGAHGRGELTPLMNRLFVRCRNLGYLLRYFRMRDIVEKILFRVNSDTSSYCLRRDLSVPFESAPARTPLTVRPLQEADIPKIVALKKMKLSRTDMQDLVSRLEHLHADIPTCYIAVAEDGSPAYMQWLMGPAQNEKIQAYFNGTFPWLEKDEALLENALTLEGFRGKGVMPAAMARIAEHGSEIGARWVMTFVEEHNTPSLKGCKKAGFSPYMMRREKWFLFRRKLTFTKLPENTPYPSDSAHEQAP